MPNSSPNLLYIHSDQHNPYVTGCYGDPLVETPNLDRLAAEGVVLENVYCPSPICVPSRMSMLSGRYPSRKCSVDEQPYPRFWDSYFCARDGSGRVISLYSLGGCIRWDRISCTDTPNASSGTTDRTITVEVVLITVNSRGLRDRHV